MPEKKDIQNVINYLDLSPHPEGGYYREIYRSSEKVHRSGSKIRSAATSIYFLIPAGVCTNWHRVSADELWHFYKGDKLMLEIIDENGTWNQLKLHNQLDADADFQELVPENCWQRAYSTGVYSLVGCTVAPGFEFDDFEMIEPDELANQYPQIASKVKRDPFS